VDGARVGANSAFIQSCWIIQSAWKRTWKRASFSSLRAWTSLEHVRRWQSEKDKTCVAMLAAFMFVIVSFVQEDFLLREWKKAWFLLLPKIDDNHVSVTLKPGLGSHKVIGTYRLATYDFLSTFHSNYGPILPFPRWFQSKIAKFSHPVFCAPADGIPLGMFKICLTV